MLFWHPRCTLKSLTCRRRITADLCKRVALVTIEVIITKEQEHNTDTMALLKSTLSQVPICKVPVAESIEFVDYSDYLNRCESVNGDEDLNSPQWRELFLQTAKNANGRKRRRQLVVIQWIRGNRMLANDERTNTVPQANIRANILPTLSQEENRCSLGSNFATKR